MAKRSYFDNRGHLLIGKTKGAHYTKVDAGFLSWACRTLDGFSSQLDTLKAAGDPVAGQGGPSLSILYPGQPKRGRKYTLQHLPHHA